MNFLVFLEHYHGAFEKGGLGVLSKAASLGDATGVVLGPGAKGLAPSAGAYGASKVYASEEPELESPLPQPRVDALAALVEKSGADAVLFGASVLSADVAAGLAARLDAGLNWDLIDLSVSGDDLVGKRPALGDTVVVDVGWTGSPRLALFRSGSLDPAESGGTAEVEDLDTEFSDFSTLATLVEQTQEESSGPSIEDADIIVAGGRGLGSPEGFSLLEELAAALGGAVAATRAVVDAGWYPVLDTGRADGEDGLAEALHRVRHLGRDPAQGRDAGLGHDRRDQQGSERAHLRLLRPRHRGRPAPDRPQADRARAGATGKLEAGMESTNAAAAKRTPLGVFARPDSALADSGLAH